MNNHNLLLDTCSMCRLIISTANPLSKHDREVVRTHMQIAHQVDITKPNQIFKDDKALSP